MQGDGRSAPERVGVNRHAQKKYVDGDLYTKTRYPPTLQIARIHRRSSFPSRRLVDSETETAALWTSMSCRGVGYSAGSEGAPVGRGREEVD